jgi:hypothetical protein
MLHESAWLIISSLVGNVAFLRGSMGRWVLPQKTAYALIVRNSLLAFGLLAIFAMVVFAPPTRQPRAKLGKSVDSIHESSDLD